MPKTIIGIVVGSGDVEADAADAAIPDTPAGE